MEKYVDHAGLPCSGSRFIKLDMNAKEKHDDYDKKWLGELCVGRKKYRMKSGEGKYIKEKVIIIAIAKDINEQQTTSHMWQVKTNYLWKKKNGEQ